MHYRLSRPLALGALSLAVVVAGCDSDSDTSSAKSTTTVSAPSNAGGAMSQQAIDYIAGGNKLCDQGSEAIQVVFPDLGPTPSVERIMQLGADLEPVFQDFRDGLDELDPPPDLAHAHQATLDAFDVAIMVLHTAGTTEAGAQAMIDAGGPPLDTVDTLAYAMFDHCPPPDEP